MKRAFGALAALFFMGCTGAASAATVLIDFENYSVGDSVNAQPSGAEYTTFGAPGSVVSVGGNKALQLAPLSGDPHFPTQFSLYLKSRVPSPIYDLIATAHNISFDVLIPDGGVLSSYWLAGSSYLTVPAAQWVTVQPRGTFYYSHFFFRGENVLIDNIRFTEGTTALPEPSTWAMLIAGFGLAGNALRRSHSRRGHHSSLDLAS